MEKRQTVLVFLALLVSCGDNPGTIGNAASPDTLYLAVSDTIGVMMGSDTLVFGFITDCGLTPGGNIAILDTQKALLQVFTPGGSEVFRMGGSGSGPGELLLPVGMAILPDGFAITDIMGGKVVFYDSTGNLQRELTGFFPSPPLRILGMPDGSLLGMGVVIDMESEGGPTGGLAMASWNESPEPVRVYQSRPIDITPTGVRAQPEFHIAAGPDGTTYLAEESDSLLLVQGYDLSGAEVFSIREEFDRVPRTEQELLEETAGISLSVENGESSVTRTRTTSDRVYRNVVVGMGVDPMGRLWLEMGVTGETFFRVYGPDGVLEAVAYPEDPAILEDASYGITPYGFTAFEPDPEDWSKAYLLEVVHH